VVSNITAQTDTSLTVRRAPAEVLRRPQFLRSFIPSAVVGVVGLGMLLASGTATLPFKRLVVVEGRMASKADYFEDAEVQRALLRHHLRVHISRTGSRVIATNDISGADFLFLSGQPAVDLVNHKLAAERHPGLVYSPYKPFSSPIVLATFRGFAERLRVAGLADPIDDDKRPFYYRLNMPGFLQEIEEGATWGKLGPGVASVNRITAWTPDICLSNSGSTYMALVAFIKNKSAAPTEADQAERLAKKIKPLLGVFGMPAPDLFNSYVTPEGRGRPIVVVYEHQFLTYQAKYQSLRGGLDEERVLLYPSVDALSEPALRPLTAVGERIGKLITDEQNEPVLRRRAVELGFRPVSGAANPDEGAFEKYLTRTGIPVPPAVGAGPGLPSLDLMESMIKITGSCAQP